MPFLEDDNNDPLGQIGTNPEFQEEQPKPELSDTFSAAFAISNSMGSFFAQEEATAGTLLGGEVYRAESAQSFKEFDPIQSLETRGRQDVFQDKNLMDKIARANSEGAIDSILNAQSKENERREVLQQAGGVGIVADIAAGTLDPINLIPVGGAVHRTYRTGGSLLKGAATTAYAATVSTTAQEALLHETQVTRTFGESAVNVGGAVLLSGLLGAGGAALARRADGSLDADGMAKDIDDNLIVPKDDEIDFTEEASIEVPDDIKSPEQLKEFMENSEISGLANAVANATTKLPKRIGLDFFDNPMTRRMTSEVAEDRELFQELAAMPLFTKGAKKGVARENVSLETQIEIDSAVSSQSELFLREQFTAHRNSKTVAGTQLGDTVLGNAKKQGKLTFTQFDQEVGLAMTKGDVHDIPEVAAAAKSYRDNVVTPLTKEAQELGLLPDDLDRTVAESYLMRVWDTVKLRDPVERSKLARIITDWLESKEVEGGRTREHLEGVSEQIIDRILSTPAGRLPYDIEVPGGFNRTISQTGQPTKELKFLIPNELVQDFLDHSATEVNSRFARSMATDINFVKRFGKGQSVDDALNMTKQLMDIQKKYNDRIKKAEKGGASKAKLKKMQKDKDFALADFATVRDRIRGTFGVPRTEEGRVTASVFNVARDLNYMRLLGGVTISSLTDLPRVAFARGVTPFFKDALPLLLTKPGALKLAKAEAQKVSRALNVIQSQRLKDLVDITDPVRSEGRISRAMSAGTKVMGNLSLINPWNDIMQSISSLMIGDGIAEAARAASKGSLTKSQRANLARLRISEDEAKLLHAQIEKHGQSEGNFTLTRSENWDVEDEAVAAVTNKYRAALREEIDRLVITPGQEKNTILSTQMGKTLLQFKSFGNSSFVKTTLLAMQNPGDAGVIAGITAQIGMGMLVLKLKSDIAGRALPEDPREWIFEGIDRSGVLSYVMDKNATLERLSGNKLGLSSALGLPGATRYQNADKLGTLLGPTAGAVNPTLQAVFDFTTGDAKKSDLRAIRRMIPFQNVFWLKGIFDRAEDTLADAFGIEE